LDRERAGADSPLELGDSSIFLFACLVTINRLNPFHVVDRSQRPSRSISAAV
jgi:hypothetical protein